MSPNPLTPEGRTARKGPEPRTALVHAKVTPSTKQAVKDLCKELGVSESEFINDLVEAKLATLNK